MLALLGAALAGVIVVSGRDSPAGVVVADRAEVVAIAVEGRWRLERGAGGWRVRHDGRDDPADPVAVERLIDAVRRVGRGLPADGVDPVQAGLDAPVIVRVEQADGPLVLEVGAPTAVGDRTYVRTPDRHVVAVSGSIGDLVDADGDAWIGDAPEPPPADANGERTGSGRR